MDDTQATALLDYLIERRPGDLKIITSEHTCGLPARGTPTEAQLLACEASEYSLKDPRHFVLHDVVGAEPHPARPGHLVAITAEGDSCESYDGPLALLVRIAEWRHHKPEDEATANAARERTLAALDAQYEILHALGEL
jgi:hypothetical protein